MAYYENNVVNTINLIDAAIEANIKYVVFSSSASVYGNNEDDLLKEECQVNPITPYGFGKYVVEKLLDDFSKLGKISYVALRYFNVAGADYRNGLGEQHIPETHLIPLVMQAASGRISFISIYGDDYPTSDGTCIRDYVHVMDVCEAHNASLRHLLFGGCSRIYNIGAGRGYSVRQIIKSAERITGNRIKTEIHPRRQGDAKKLVSDISLISKDLGWKPKFSDIETLLSDAWKWEKLFPWH
jgi:UDP-glucose 4-epimerase